MRNEQKLEYDFYRQDALDVAPQLIGKILVRKMDDGTELHHRILETEIYRERRSCLSCQQRKNTKNGSDVLGRRIHICLSNLWNTLVAEHSNRKRR